MYNLLTARRALCWQHVVRPSLPTLRHTATGLVDEWAKMLQESDNQDVLGPSTDALQALKGQLKDAVKTQSARLSTGVLPETISTTFINIYSATHDPTHKAALFKLLCAKLGVQEPDVTKAVYQWQDALQRPTNARSELLNRTANELQAACRPLYTHLFLPISQQPQGVKFLLDMRADLLQHLQQQPAYAADLRTLSEHLRAALAAWFSVGSLQVHRLTWQATPAAFLEKVMASEAVHPLSGWEELKQRLGPGRRVYAVSHPSMAEEPLVVLHTALMRGVPSSLPQVLQQPTSQLPGEERQATTAAFYSISSTQKGLAGVDLGNFLIKRVASLVQAEFPSITTLVTLSPVPNFRAWLHARLLRPPPKADPLQLQGLPELQDPTTAAQLEVLAGQLAGDSEEASGANTGLTAVQRALLQLLEGDRWLQLPGHGPEVVQNLLLRLAAVYLVRERRRNLALDPVANFHLRNGACLHRILGRADLSSRGLQRSHGIMVNYLYDLPRVAANNQLYLVDHQVATSPDVDALL